MPHYTRKKSCENNTKKKNTTKLYYLWSSRLTEFFYQTIGVFKCISASSDFFVKKVELYEYISMYVDRLETKLICLIRLLGIN